MAGITTVIPDGSATTGSGFRVEYGTDGTTYNNGSEEVTTVKWAPGKRKVANKYAFERATPHIALGKKSPTSVTLGLIYNEISGNFAETIQSAYDNGTLYYLRITPLGSVGAKWTYGSGYFLDPPVPDGEADSEEVKTVDVEFQFGTITTGTVS
jgi:hypothetical protein